MGIFADGIRLQLPFTLSLGNPMVNSVEYLLEDHSN